MKIELNEKERVMLKQYASVFKEEREIDFTANPIIVVQKKERIPTVESYDVVGYWYEILIDCNIDDKFYYISLHDNETPIKISNIEDKICKELKTVISDRSIISDFVLKISSELFYNNKVSEHKIEYVVDNISLKAVISIIPFTFIWENVAYFFTRAEAERYIKYQSHNLDDYRIYTTHVGHCNNGDFPVFQKLLLRMGNQLCFEDNKKNTF